jgi:dTMP kinase
VFISFEGMDGSGKTTQIGKLAAALGENGHAVLVTREPGGTALGESLRRILLEHAAEEPTPLTEALLFLADRHQHLSRTILPALSGGTIVICDRYIDSTVAYQGFGKGLDVSLLEALNTLATGGRNPDLTILLDVPPETLQLRRGLPTNDRFEDRATDFHERVCAGYRTLAGKSPGRFLVLDGRESVEMLHARILDRVRASLTGPFT